MPGANKRGLTLGLLVLGLLSAARPACADTAAPAAPLSLTLTNALVETGSADMPGRVDEETGGATAGAGFSLKPGSSAPGLRGFVQPELARTISDPDHWSKMRLRTELSAQGRLNEQIRWKLSGRLDYDAVYDVTNFYPRDVRDDQRLEVMARENYLDINAGNWDIRLGRQQIVWGEIVGLFFADVVSARDMREFLLPDFDILRIPQWAARAEYAGERFHAEILWVPVASYDKIGRPGAEFFPMLPPTPPGFGQVFLGDTRPARTASNTNYGVRLSTLQNGWDVSGFYYRSMDTQPTFYRRLLDAPQPTFGFEARHDRITQLGSTIAKDFGWTVVRGEAVYTRGRQFNVIRASDPDGVVPQKTLDWIASVDFSLPADFRVNLQLFQRVFFEHDPDTLLKDQESGYSVYFTRELTDELEAQVLFMASLERTDWMLRPKLVWKFEKNWRLTTGVDLFHGPPFGFFGRFANRDRVYSELRYSF
jgi:hypothetical protein